MLSAFFFFLQERMTAFDMLDEFQGKSVRADATGHKQNGPRMNLSLDAPCDMLNVSDDVRVRVCVC